MTELLTQGLNALVLGWVYVLIASGVTLIYGLTNTVMFAQGSLLVVGAYVTYALMSIGAPFAVAALGAAVLLGLLGVVLHLGLFHWVRDRPINGFIISLGLILVIDNLVVTFSDERENVSIQPPLATVWDVGGVRVAAQQVLVVVVGAVLMALFLLFLRRSRLGWALRATAEDRDTAALMGVPPVRVVSAAFAVGSALAGIGGALLISLFPVTPFTGSSVVLFAFAVAIIGGLGSVEGTVVAALLLAVAQGLGAGYLDPQLSQGYAFALMIVMLLIRPRGLFRAAASGGQLH